MKHICKGCRSEPSCKKYVYAMKKIHINKCVCRICLIKGVCSDPCDDFTNLFKNYYEGKYLTYIWWIKKYRKDMEGKNIE